MDALATPRIPTSRWCGAALPLTLTLTLTQDSYLYTVRSDAQRDAEIHQLNRKLVDMKNALHRLESSAPEAAPAVAGGRSRRGSSASGSTATAAARGAAEAS